MVPLHGIGGRQDLPLPFEIVLVAAAAAVVVSFLVLAAGWRTPRFTRNTSRALPGLTRIVDHAAVRWAVRGFGLAMSGWAALALLFGPDLLTNPIFGYLYVWIWVGLVPVSLLFGVVWRTLSPFRTLHLLITRATGRPPSANGRARLPGWVGLWPAAILLFSFVWLELVAPDPDTKPVLLLWFAIYLVAMLIGGALFGPRWYAAADPFEAYATIMAKLSPWGRNPQHTVVARSPLANLATLRPVPGTVAFVTILLGSTAYDGFSNSTFWIAWLQQQADPAASLALSTAALVGMIAAVAVSYRLAVYLSGKLTGSTAAGNPDTYIHSLVPIALGYAVAHYLTLFLFEGQRTLFLWSDPLALGWNVFGTAELGISRELYDYTTAFAITQASAVVTGHILGIVAAHDRALEIAPRRAAIGQIPMLLVMVGYTLGGLGLLFAQ